MIHSSLRYRIFLLLIIILAAILRLYKVTQVPPGVNRDEASIGYTAYSLLKTGKDEYGRAFPISFQSFGDWKLPLYIYSTVPFVAVFGLNELAVRLPSVVAGVFTVFITYLLVQELFKKTPYVRRVSLIASLLVAISPWHIHLSRVESESNVSVLLVALGTLLFLKSIRKNWLLMPISLCFALTYYTYHGNHIFTTLFLIGLAAIYGRRSVTNRYSKISLVLFVILAGMILSQTLLKADSTKISGISIFSDPTIVHTDIELKRNEHDIPYSYVSRFIHNRLAYAIETIAQNYVKAYSPEFLFIHGGSNRAHNIQNFGNMYLVEAPLILLGLFLLLAKYKGKNAKLLILWLAIAPIAASITRDAPHSNRMFAVFPVISIVVALGIENLLLLVHGHKIQRYVFVSLIGVGYILNIALYLDRYYVHFPKNESIFWGAGYKKVASIIDMPDNRGRKIIISKPEQSPYIFLLFYTQYDPASYQQIAKRYEPTNDGFYHVASFDRFEFRTIDWGRDVSPNQILVLEPDEIPNEIRSSHDVEDLRYKDTVVFSIIKT